jgi:CelD/BcsL family acetyltransferase involved in cellulose biosynthesis
LTGFFFMNQCFGHFNQTQNKAQSQPFVWPANCKIACMLAGNWQMMLASRIREVADFDGFLLPWKRLAHQSIEPVGLNSPELILPLLINLKTAELAVVTQGDDLLLALPMQKTRMFWSNWITPLTVIGTPHLDREFPAAALTAFTDSLEQPLLLHSIDVNGKFWDCLTACDTHFAILNRWERAVLKPTGSFDAWLETNFDRKRRKEYRRQSSRLAEQGKYETLSLERGGDSKAWVEDILALEAAGWKGKRGTAIASDKFLKAAFAEACQQLAASGKLRFWKMVLDGKAIASMYAIVEGDQAWLGKIAYDEAYAKYSPGVLLILHATEKLFAESPIKLVDSCAIPGHPMIENIWRDRLAMADVMLAPKSIGAAKFKIIVKLEKLRRSLRGKLRDACYRLKGVKRS